MIKYIKDSIRELKHVVWPTREETTNYFVIVVSVLVLFGLYLFIASTLFTKGLFGLQKIVQENKDTSEVILPKDKLNNLDLNIISNEVKISNNSTGSSEEIEKQTKISSKTK